MNGPNSLKSNVHNTNDNINHLVSGLKNLPPALGGRKTSAEIVQEARTLLSKNGARLISTRRPITPKDVKRQLFGKLAPPGRPPSAFSLRYLQSENNRLLPSLEPIPQQATNDENNFNTDGITIVRRSGSVGTLFDYSSNSTNRPQGKLPALLAPPKITASLNNLSEEIPPHHPRCILNIDNSKIINDNDEYNSKEILNSNLNKNNINEEEQHPLIKRQTKSFDIFLPLKPPIPPSRNAALKTKETNNNSNESMINSKKDVTNLTPTNIINSNTLHFKQNNDNITFMQQKNKNSIQDENAIENDVKNFLIEKANGEDNNLTQKLKLSIRTNDLLAQSTTDTLLDLLKQHSGIKECNEETVQHINAILIELYTRVKGATKGNWRSAILGGLYGLVECTSPKILLAIARVVLALCVTGSNLTGACKLVFKVARNEANDYLFYDTDVPELLIDGLGRASPIEDTESCVYGYGAIRFLANSGNNLNNDQTANIIQNIGNNNNGSSHSLNNKQKSIALRLANHGAVQLMVLHLQLLNEAGGNKHLAGPPLHALYQLSASLRTLAGIPQINFNLENRVNSGKQNKCNEDEKFFTNNENYPIIRETKDIQDINLELACPHLVKAAEISMAELEIQANIIRTLSVLSEHETCCNALAEYSARIGMLLGPCGKFNIPGNVENAKSEKSLTILSRLGYILGNIMAKFDEARVQFYQNDVAMEYLMDVFDTYSKQKFTLHNQIGDTVVDVLIKLVRVIANMSVNGEVGYELGMKPPLGRILLHLLITINRIGEICLTTETEELLHAVLGALHNLSFYQDEAVRRAEEVCDNNYGSMRDLISELNVALCDTFKYATESVQSEAARVLGNMTRNSIARNSFCSVGGLKIIINCLKSENYELKSNCSGVLVNLLGDWERRAPFLELQGPMVLKDILHKSAEQQDWVLAGIICQALWNYLIDSGNVIRALGKKEVDQISGQLAEYLDEEKIFQGKSPDTLWEQFAAVATDLLEKIQIELSNEHTPYASGDEDEDAADVHIQKLPNDGLMEGKWDKRNFTQWIND